MKTVRELFQEFRSRLIREEHLVSGDFDSFMIGGWESQVEILKWMGAVLLSLKKATLSPKVKGQIMEKMFLEKVDSVNLEITNHWRRVENLKKRKKIL